MSEYYKHNTEFFKKSKATKDVHIMISFVQYFKKGSNAMYIVNVET